MTPPPAPRPVDGLPEEPIMGMGNPPPVKHCPHCYFVMPSACRTCPGCFQYLPRKAELR